MSNDAQILKQIDDCFGAISKPEHFTNYTHCDECEEHDTVLRSRDRQTLSLEDVGNPGWDPLCFSSPQGIAYYMPTLVRLALAPPSREHGWYAEQLLFHLYAGFKENAFYQYCSPPQRAAVAAYLQHILETRAEFVGTDFLADELLRCYALWSEQAG
jgi:hypothetical protein